ncbi:MAG: hypothetical protein GY913_05305 [Proteobacteria bacterium]|nr:hypothetical protein [Pseudomonadota bacterium]MCP4916319.1 hypothetical protein [Pseudomonadota bacterium]
MPSRRRIVALLLAFGLVLPFVDKPVHVDDANFLVLARGAALDFWRPHAIDINWQGTTEPAFEVLSNPPGIGWWLAPVHDASVAVQHLWMLPWLLLALFGAARLGRYFLDDEDGGLMLLGTLPLLALAGQALTPDLPLFACTVAGMGGFLTSRRFGWPFALLAGAAVLFRYSGLCLIPLVLYAGRRRWKHAVWVLAPLVILALHDLHAYGRIHLVAMGSFQSVSNTPWDVAHKGVAAIAALGGVGVLPVLSARGKGWVGGLVGAGIGGAAGLASGLDGVGLGMTVLAVSAGAMALSTLRFRDPKDQFLALWALGGLVFLLSLRFTAARYWLPFLVAPALASARLGLSDRALAAAVVANVLIAFGVSWDDRELARAQLEAAERIGAGPGTFAGHWGWQHHLEGQGWTALEDEGTPGVRHVVALAPWPQEPDGTCLVEVDRFSVPDTFFGPRTHTRDGAANLHAFVVAGDPIVETYAPWSFSSEPYDEVVLFERCD